MVVFSNIIARISWPIIDIFLKSDSEIIFEEIISSNDKSKDSLISNVNDTEVLYRSSLIKLEPVEEIKVEQDNHDQYESGNLECIKQDCSTKKIKLLANYFEKILNSNENLPIIQVKILEDFEITNIDIIGSLDSIIKANKILENNIKKIHKFSKISNKKSFRNISPENKKKNRFLSKSFKNNYSSDTISLHNTNSQSEDIIETKIEITDLNNDINENIIPIVNSATFSSKLDSTINENVCYSNQNYSDTESTDIECYEKAEQSMTDKNVNDIYLELYKEFNNQTPVKEHIDPTDKLFPCVQCDYVAPDKRAFEQHKARMHGEKTLKCTECTKLFALQNDLNKHMKGHTNKFVCDFCKKEFRMKCNYLKHVKRVHHHIKVPPNKYPCKDCAKVCRSRKDLEIHRHKVHHEPISQTTLIYKSLLPKRKNVKNRYDGKNISCQQCTYIAPDKRALNFHMARKHSDRMLSCTSCSRTFALEKDLNIHLKSHTSKFPCDTCGKVFTVKNNLQMHINFVHLGLQRNYKNYLCPDCGHVSRNRTDFDAHKNKVHLGKHIYFCKVCNMGFYTSAALKGHSIVHTEVSKFMCPECGKTFNFRAGYVYHMRIHNSEKPYSCDYCQKSFSQQGALVRHKRIHTKEKPYVCNLCSSDFNDQSILRRHLIGVHKQTDSDKIRLMIRDSYKKKTLTNTVLLREDNKHFPPPNRGGKKTYKLISSISNSNLDENTNDSATCKTYNNYNHINCAKNDDDCNENFNSLVIIGNNDCKSEFTNITDKVDKKAKI